MQRLQKENRIKMLKVIVQSNTRRRNKTIKKRLKTQLQAINFSKTQHTNLLLYSFSLNFFYCSRQLRRGGDCTSQARALVNGDRREEGGLACTGDLILSSYQLLFQTTLLCGLLCLSPLFSAVIGWASLVSNLRHLDECVPPPFMLH